LSDLDWNWNYVIASSVDETSMSVKMPYEPKPSQVQLPAELLKLNTAQPTTPTSRWKIAMVGALILWLLALTLAQLKGQVTLPPSTGSSGLSLSLTVGSGTAALGTSEIAANGACATAITVAATGIATTDVILWTPNADITGVTGYDPTGGQLQIFPYTTAGNVNFKVCNPTASAITPGAVTLNWRVIR